VAHIGGIDTLARALLAAAEVIEARKLAALKKARYQGWDGELGQRIEQGKIDLATLADLAATSNFQPTPRSGQQELAESLIARTCKF
jgi:xylose isomerase